MHVIIGGAHNGKREFVRKLLTEEDITWHVGEIPEPGNDTVVIAGLENWLAQCELSEENATDFILKAVENRRAIIILTDISRGIVPMDANLRKLRDTCGRLYQRLFAEASEVTKVWYGIPQHIKKRGD
ncbi:bifunctional adenosylcobinamide kinase/adenosylcobinamide-phosphate guanylyltransferase [Sporosarcina sp. Marseille-Q4063]|uniref:bifunctional adenosylcobinamide kinase/adenosylcobinamide-phosphate guanylyltransferase n=1 Tax=Sporosarcina sp. Marseille-Q4063 TaxID=2810514 RepID=UPI001BAFDCAA|nr:bifunctional adenosylcobinamide kinase/adenosylcobinamide-phosphate guanylyltransferase [Sporosarcina sp. Marseille-Q4063]QUW21132.1 bifunctional adenosylcobinamide kinase/adenosylcobinamide-phosphate guanylyltransferase [Sporosarcina sp. Marseille-Q4063]